MAWKRPPREHPLTFHNRMVTEPWYRWFNNQIEAYIDEEITLEDLDIAGDTGTGSVDLDSQSLTIAGGGNIDTVASGQTITIALEDDVVIANTLTVTGDTYLDGNIAEIGGDGDCNLRAATDVLTLENLSGETNIYASGNIDIQTVTGNIDIVAGAFTNARFASGTGDVEFYYDVTVYSELYARGGIYTISGDGGTSLTAASNDLKLENTSGTVTVSTTGGNATLESTTSQIQIRANSLTSLYNNGTLSLQCEQDNDVTIPNGTLTVKSDMVIDTGSLTSVSGAISLNDDNLTTTGIITTEDIVINGSAYIDGGSGNIDTKIFADGAVPEMSNLALQANTTDRSTSLSLAPNGTGGWANNKSQIAIFNTDWYANKTDYQLLRIWAANSEYRINMEPGGALPALQVRFTMDDVSVFTITENATFKINSNQIADSGENDVFQFDGSGNAYMEDSLRVDTEIILSAGGMLTVEGNGGTVRDVSLLYAKQNANYGTVGLYPTTGTNAGNLFVVSPRGTGNTIDSAVFAMETDFVADTTNYSYISMWAGPNGRYLDAGTAGTGMTPRNLYIRNQNVTAITVTTAGDVSFPTNVSMSGLNIPLYGEISFGTSPSPLMNVATQGLVSNWGVLEIYPTYSTGNTGNLLLIGPQGTGASTNYRQMTHFLNTDFQADRSNYESLRVFCFGANGFYFGPYRAGTGTARNLTIENDGNAALVVSTTGLVTISQDVIRDSSNASAITFDGSANTTITGTLIAGGDAIQDSSEANAITFDGAANGTAVNDWTVNKDLYLYAGTRQYIITNTVGVTGISFSQNESGYGSAYNFHNYDGDGTDSIAINMYAEGSYADRTNSSRLAFGFSASATEYTIRTVKSGTGTARDLVLYTESNTDQLKLHQASNLVSVAGTLRLDGNAIQDSGATDALTFDGSTNATLAGTLNVEGILYPEAGIYNIDGTGANIIDDGDGGLYIGNVGIMSINASTTIWLQADSYLRIYTNSAIAAEWDSSQNMEIKGNITEINGDADCTLTEASGTLTLDNASGNTTVKCTSGVLTLNAVSGTAQLVSGTQIWLSVGGTSVIGIDSSYDVTIQNGDLNVNTNTTLGKGTKCDGMVITDVSEVQTTDATQTTVGTVTLLDENTYNIKSRIVGVKSDGTDRASYEIIGTFYRTGAGNATQQGSTTVLHSAESDASWDATFTVSGNDVRVSVTGVAATTIEWGCDIEYINMSN